MSFKHRVESFGGVLAIENPPLLVHVDQEFMREIGCQESPLWQKPDTGILSAPLEVHFSVTNRCSAGCRHCYMDSGKIEEGELAIADFRRALDMLAEMGVFHIAMGGGEALERPDFFEIAEYARALGMVPNLTTNGLLLTRETAERCKVFGQVNVSVDWVIRPTSGLEARVKDAPLQGIDLLLQAGIKVGLNCVVTRHTYDNLDEVIAYAAAYKLVDVEFLRFKPSGRGANDYYQSRLTPEQTRDFYPRIKTLSEKHGVAVKIDCSFVPMFCWHRPDKALMEQFSVYGCDAGNILLGIRSNGKFGGCSFLPGEEDIFDLPRLWNESEELAQLRRWKERSVEPCQSCDYLSICKGGCRAVATYVTGDRNAPDPECPFVIDYNQLSK